MAATHESRPVGHWDPTRKLPRLVLLAMLLGFLAGLLVLEAEGTGSIAIPLALVPVGLAALRLPIQDVWLVAAVAVVIAVLLVILDLEAGRLLMLALVLGLCWLLIRYAQARDSVGLNAFRGFSALAQLSRETLASLESSPVPGWQTSAAVAPSAVDAFRGDFLVGRLDSEGQAAFVGVVDVSGHGIEAALRAVGLSGAVNALAGALPFADVLPAASAYVRGGWEAGDFATAVVASLDLLDGSVVLASAGHPAALFRRADGGWEQLETSGPALGILESPAFSCATAALAPGDSLVLFSDGLVESRSLELDEGTARLMTLLDPFLAADSELNARTILDDIAPGQSDDVSLLLIRRR